MAGRLLGRLVSTLGVPTAEAARQACGSTARGSLLPAAAQTRHPWSALYWGAGLSTSASTSTAAAVEVAQASAAPAAAATPPGSGSGDQPQGADSASPAPSSGAGGDGVASAAPPLHPSQEPKPELVDKFLSSEVFGLAERWSAERLSVMRQFQRHPADTGSPQVMVALWTHRLREMVKHFDANRKQLPSMRELEMMRNQRRRMLTWLRRSDFEAYSYTITKLGLQDIYTPVGISDRYREGLRPSDPVKDDTINRLRFNFHTEYRQKKSSLWQRLRPQLLAEDPQLAAVYTAAAAADKQLKSRQRAAAAQQRL